MRISHCAPANRTAAIGSRRCCGKTLTKSLRQALAALRKSLPGDAHKALLADTESVGIDPAIVRSDLHAFRRALNAGTRTSLQEAMSHYRGDLLDGFDARSTAFDEWL